MVDPRDSLTNQPSQICKSHVKNERPFLKKIIILINKKGRKEEKRRGEEKREEKIKKTGKQIKR